MSQELFLITGGGTGAKVAESLVHLAASGSAPSRVHVLLVDADTANGNLNRAAATVRAYQALKRWPWTVQAKVKFGVLKGSESVWLELFGTRFELYELTEPIRTVLGGGLESSAGTPEMHQVLDLLYDESEQKATCEDGFRARPNLGCLLMADHLAEKLPERAAGFLQAMHAAGQGEGRIPVVVAASVFGGTGAALLPVVRSCIERILRERMSDAMLDRFQWAAVKVLPHYQPHERRESVDPDRYLLDSASALQFYATTYETSPASSRFDAVYVIGSDTPGRNRVKTVTGRLGQANPPYFEEVLAAMAVLDFARQPPPDGQPTAVFAPDALDWGSLPSEDWLAFRERMAYLLHAAAFFHRRESAARTEQRTQGLGMLMLRIADDDLKLYPWYKRNLAPWAKFHESFRAAPPERQVTALRNNAQMKEHSVEAMIRPMADYFGRLLLWSETALKGTDLAYLDFVPENYADLYNVMAEVVPQEVSVASRTGHEVQMLEPSHDNALVRVLRTAIAAMVHAHRHAVKGKPLGAHFVLVDENRILLRTNVGQVHESLRDHQLNEVIEEYTRTQA